MNNNQFKIWKKRREEKCKRELEKLRDDLASKGMAIGGYREKEEEWLRRECDSEINQRKEESKEYKKEIKWHRIERSTSMIINIILALIALFSFYLTRQENIKSNQLEEKINKIEIENNKLKKEMSGTQTEISQKFELLETEAVDIVDDSENK